MAKVLRMVLLCSNSLLAIAGMGFLSFAMQTPERQFLTTWRANDAHDWETCFACTRRAHPHGQPTYALRIRHRVSTGAWVFDPAPVCDSCAASHNWPTDYGLQRRILKRWILVQGHYYDGLEMPPQSAARLRTKITTAYLAETTPHLD